MDTKEERHPYQIDKLEIKPNEEIERENEKGQIKFIISGAITETQRQRKKTEDCVIYRKTLSKELKKAFGLFPAIDFSKHFELVAHKSVSGRDKWNWGYEGARGGVIFTDDELEHRYIVLIF